MKGIGAVEWDAAGCVPVVVQDAGSGIVLALARMDRAALTTTLATGRAHYWTDEDGTLGGCTASGAPQMVTEVRIACDGRSLVIQVQPAGAIRRTGNAMCFEEELSAEANSHTAERLDASLAAMDDVAIRWSREAAEGN